MICITASSSIRVRIFFCFVISLLILLSGQFISLASQNSLDNIRIHKFKSKTRIVLDFLVPIKNYNISSIDKNTTCISIDQAVLSSNIESESNIDNNYKINFEQNNSKIDIKLNIPNSNMSIFTLEEPFRLIIDLPGLKNSSRQLKPTLNQLNQNKAPQKTGNELYTGVSHKQYNLAGPVFVNVVDTDLNNPNIDLKPVIASPNTLFSKRSVNQMVNNTGSIAGINASFFKPPNGLPLGVLIINKEYYTGPILDRVALIIDDNNRAYIDKIKFESVCFLSDGTMLKIQNINQPRMSVEGFMLYSDRWNTMVPQSLKNELQVAILNGRVISKSTIGIKVPSDGFVLTGPNKDSFKNIKIGDPIFLMAKSVSSVSNIKHAIGGGPYLVKNGQVYVDSSAQKFSINPNTRDPRTAIGITSDNHLLMVTVDGRQKGSAGMSFYQLASFLKSLGAVQAMNLDGGSSTQMSIKGRIVNRPTVKGGALVSTAIIVKPSDSYSVANMLP